MVKGLKAILVKFTLFTLVSAFLLLLLVNTMVNGLPGDSRDFNAKFTDVSGLRVGDDVKVAGVRVGRVTAIEVDGAGAEVGFELSEDQQMLETTKLVMRYQNLLGQRYLALVQNGARGSELKGGTTIPVSKTDPGFDLTALLNGFRPLFEILQPADVNKLATSMVKVLQGEGGTVESLLQETSQLTNFLADRDQVIGDVLDNLTPVLDNLAGQGDELRTTVQELKALMTGLARDRKSIGSSIEGVSRLVGTTSEFLNDVRAPAVGSIKRLRSVARVMSASREQLSTALRSFGVTFEGLGRSASYESALNVYLCSILFGVGGLDAGGGNGPYSQVCR